MIGLQFKCSCMSKDRKVFVRERLPDEDISTWMEQVVQVQLSAAHFSVSPLCRATKMEYVKIPVSRVEGSPLGALSDEERKNQKLD